MVAWIRRLLGYTVLSFGTNASPLSSAAAGSPRRLPACSREDQRLAAVARAHIRPQALPWSGRLHAASVPRLHGHIRCAAQVSSAAVRRMTPLPSAACRRCQPCRPAPEARLLGRRVGEGPRTASTRAPGRAGAQRHPVAAAWCSANGRRARPFAEHEALGIHVALPYSPKAMPGAISDRPCPAALSDSWLRRLSLAHADYITTPEAASLKVLPSLRGIDNPATRQCLHTLGNLAIELHDQPALCLMRRQ